MMKTYRNSFHVGQKLVPLLCAVTIFFSDNQFTPIAADKRPQTLRKTTNAAGEPVRTRININRVSSWYDADGREEWDSQTGNAGLIFPTGTTTAVFASGLIWSGEHYDGQTPVIRTNGAEYNTGLVRGAILGQQAGQIEDPDASDVRIWRIRRDFATADLTEDAAEINGVTTEEVTLAQIDAVRNQYQTDWLEWPAQKGAPFYDADGDGSYIPSVINGEPVHFPDADEPGLANADQVIWYVANDIGGRSPWGATPSPGIELQQTIWAYASTLTDEVFKRYRLIYKGNSFTPDTARISQMYIGKWSDPDLGTYSDDFAGCDSLLGLGYCYNSSPVDDRYGLYDLPPPAIGYVLLAGPGDIGQRNFGQTPDRVLDPSLGSFVYCGNDPPPGYGCLNISVPFGYGDALRWNCLLQGYPGDPQPPPCPPRPIDPATGGPSPRFWLYGNPLRGTGWIDGIIEGPGDRRILLGTGPFTLALGDTQEILVGVVGGLGNDNLNSINVLKKNANLARIVASSSFSSLPGPPSSPEVVARPFDREILLDWESDSSAVARTEDSTIIGEYRFEGYKVYQFPDETGTMTDAKLIAQYDLVNGVTAIRQLMPDPVTGELLPVNVEYGTDSGINRTLAVGIDSLRDGAPLVNGRWYYFGVSAYNYTIDTLLITRTYESAPAIVAIQPETPKPGTRLPYSIGDTVTTITQLSGSSDALIAPVVYNPEKQTGETYQLSFDTTSEGILAWTLTNEQNGSVPYSAIEDIAGGTPYRVQPGGFDLFVQAPMPGVAGVVDEDSMNAFGTLALSIDGTLEGFRGSTETGEDYEIRFGEESFALRAGNLFSRKAVRVPFAVYDAGRGARDPSSREVMAVFVDSSDNDLWDLTPARVPVGDSTYNTFEPIYGTLYDYVPDDPLTSLREDSAAVKQMQNILNNVSYEYPDPSGRAFYALFLVDLDRDSLPPTEGLIRIIKQHELRDGDEYQIALQSVVTGNTDLARNDISQIKAFPNPYYAANADETASSGQFITFNHLPAKSTIRIYNLAGIHVRRLEKDDPMTQYFRWDLKNEHGALVGSGIYLVYMELRDEQGVELGTRFLKLVIIQGTR